MIRRFKVNTTIEYEHIIEIDDEVWTEEALKEWSSVFFDVDLEGHAENIAQLDARLGDRFMEGYGHPLRQGKESFSAKLSKSESNNSINIITITDEDITQDSYEILD